MLIFEERGKTGELGEIPGVQNRTRITLVEGEGNHHYAIPSPTFPNSLSFSLLVHSSCGFLQTKPFAAQAKQIENEHNY